MYDGDDIMSKPISRILAAVDSSPPSPDGIAELAIGLSRPDCRTEIVFLHIVDIPSMLARAERGGSDYALALSAARDAGAAVLERCCAFARAEDVVAHAVMRSGSPVDEIAVYARQIAADVIVIGNHPSNWLKRFVAGSVRDELVRNAGVPVLVAGTAAVVSGARQGWLRLA